MSAFSTEFSGEISHIEDFISEGPLADSPDYSYTSDRFSTPLNYFPDSELLVFDIPTPCNCHVAIATSGTPIGTDGNHIREFLFRGQQLRIRQDGAISKISLYINELTGVDRFYVTFWRFNGTTYDRVGRTENIIGDLTEGEINELTLDNPVTGLNTGDYYGVKIIQSSDAIIYPLIQCPVYNARVFWFDSDPGDTNVDFLHGSDGFSSNGRGVPVICFMAPPVVVTIGDSITSGHPYNFSLIETNHRTNLSSSYPWLLTVNLNVTVQNMGIGANSIGQIEARFYDDCVRLHPRVVVIEAGVNDIMIGTPTNQYLGSWESLLEQCSKNGIRAVVIGIFPWTNGTSQQMVRRDALNVMVCDLVKSYDGFVYIDPDIEIGRYRPSGPPGNLWDIREEFDIDGIHYTDKGYGHIAFMVSREIAKFGY